MEDLLKPENKDKLAAVLSYHVLPRKLISNQLPDRTIHVRTIKSSDDRTLAVSKSGSGVTVDQANVITADIAASNGVVHVIDKVILPTVKSGDQTAAWPDCRLRRLLFGTCSSRAVRCYSAAATLGCTVLV